MEDFTVVPAFWWKLNVKLSELAELQLKELGNAVNLLME